jgi:hypothetical protein
VDPVIFENNKIAEVLAEISNYLAIQVISEKLGGEQCI